MTVETENAGGLLHLALTGTDPTAWGEQHGEAFADAIAELYDIRLGLMLERTDLQTETNVLALAERHLAPLRAFDHDLTNELEGIARGSGLTRAQIVVVNHYTDLRDLSLKEVPNPTEPDPGGCSVLFSPQMKMLSQTWDMHGSATDFTAVLEVPARVGAEFGEKAAIFTIVGCLGMCGINHAGVGMTINNLNSVDAKIGVAWPALVRAALREPSALKARAVIDAAQVGSGHHYAMADANDFFGVTTSGVKKKLTQEGIETPWVHTNHCTDEEMAATTRKVTTSTSTWRREKLDEVVASGRVPQTPDTIMKTFEQVEMARNPELPNAVATCGAVVMDLESHQMHAIRGLPSESTPLVLDA